MTKTPPKSSKSKPKPTIATLQKEIRSLKRTISEQCNAINYLKRQCCYHFEMCRSAEAELAAIHSAGNTKSKKGK
jgi:hypothetical protein